MATLERAIEIAVHNHKGQKQRNGQPYILHPLRLMLNVDTDDAKIVAVLHDVVEDTSYTFADLEKDGFSKDVLAALKLLTHDKDEPYEPYVEKIAQNPLAKKVKLADLRDNMDVTRLDKLEEKDTKRLEKYHKAWKRLT